MTGLEPLASLSLACNVMQIISFSHETYSIYCSIQDGGCIMSELASRTGFLSTLSQQIQDKLTNASLPAFTLEQKELYDIAHKCLTMARDMDTELCKLQIDNGSHISRLKKTFRILRKKSKIQAMEREMNNFQTILQSRLIFALSNQNDAATLQQTKAFNTLDQSLRQFITQYSLESRTLPTMLRRGADATIQSVVKDMKDIMEASKTSAAGGKLIEILRFTGVDDRQDTIKEAYPETFRWIFHPIYSQEPPSEQRPDWDSFTGWLELKATSISDVYWISGKAGSGKSTLMKYLFTAAKTRTILDTSNRERCLILSYFFTLSGSYLQQSTKGMLRSILSQILAAEPNQAVQALSEFPHLSSKRRDSAWSEQELIIVLQWAVRVVDRPICIFVDGLDELHKNEDVFNLINRIREISAFPKVKVCVASRPEGTFRDEFHATPRLRLQDLSRADIVRYVTGKLKRFEDRIANGHNYRNISAPLDCLINSVSRKSEGVFLWAYLVVRQLELAIVSGDSYELLQRRLDDLPSDLIELFDQMWSRHGENKQRYQAEAASCFNAVLSARKLRQWTGGNHNYDSILLPAESGVSLLEFTLALRQDICKLILLNDLYPSGNLIMDACRAAQRRTESICIGFLEISKNKGQHRLAGVPDGDDSFITFDSSFKALLQFANLNVSFIHRAAEEYLIGPGKSIIQGEETSLEQGCPQLFTACLAVLRIIISERPASFYKLMDALWCFSRYIPRRAQSTLLGYCQNLWQRHRILWFSTGSEEYCGSASIARHIYHSTYHRRHPIGDAWNNDGAAALQNIRFPLFFESGRLDFLSWASRYGYGQFVLQSITSLEETRTISTEYKSYLLQSASNFLPMFSSDIKEHCDLICALLEQGADPNILCPYEFSSDEVEGSRPIETFVYALLYRLVFTNSSAIDHEVLSRTLNFMVRRTNVDQATFSSYPGFIDGPLGFTKRPAYCQSFIPHRQTIVYMSISVGQLISELFIALQNHCKKLANWYSINDLPALCGRDVSDIVDMVLIAEPVYYKDEANLQNVSHWVGRLPTEQEYAFYHDSRRMSTQSTDDFFSEIGYTNAKEVYLNLDPDPVLDIDDITQFLVDKGLHKRLYSGQVWDKQDCLDDFGRSKNPGYRTMSYQAATQTLWRRQIF